MGLSGVAGGITGGMAMNGIIDYVNNNTDSTLFKHETPAPQTETVRKYADGVIENNERILNMWEDPTTLNARIDGLMDAGLSRNDAIRYLMAYHDATDRNLSNGYFNQIGMDPNALNALRSSINGTTVNITPEAMQAFEHFNPHISETNTVGYVPGAPVSTDNPDLYPDENHCQLQIS